MDGAFLNLLEANVAKIGVRDVSDKEPSNFEDPLPFVGCPHGATSRIVNLNGMVIMWKLWGAGCTVLTGVSISAIPQKWPLSELFSLVK